MTHKFYQDLAAWLELWLQTNVGTNPNKLPVDLDLKHIVRIITQVIFLYIYRHHWNAPLQKTADILNLSTRTISRAVKK